MQKKKYICQQLSDKDIAGGCVHGQSASEAKPLVFQVFELRV